MYVLYFIKFGVSDQNLTGVLGNGKVCACIHRYQDAISCFPFDQFHSQEGQLHTHTKYLLHQPVFLLLVVHLLLPTTDNGTAEGRTGNCRGSECLKLKFRHILRHKQASALCNSQHY